MWIIHVLNVQGFDWGNLKKVKMEEVKLLLLLC
jgi:hypothetical protein